MGALWANWFSGKRVRTIFSSLMEMTRTSPYVSTLAEGGPFWNKLPRLLNIARSRMKAELRGDILDYEPIHLHVNPVETRLSADPADSTTQAPDIQLYPSMTYQPLSLDNFRFLLEQVPAVRTIEFSGKEHDPLENPDLLKMVDYAAKFNGAECSIETNGLLVQKLADEILRSRLHALVIRLYAHRPSLYALMAHQPLSRFVEIKSGLEYLIRQKQILKSRVEVELCMTVDIHNFREMPDMIRFAEVIGADALRFENYLSSSGDARSDRTLYTSQKPVMRYLKELKQTVLQSSRLAITLPVPLAPDMSSHRHCLEPYSTVSVDAEFNISGCSRQLLHYQHSGKVWDPDFFNNDMYQWLRSIYGPPASHACQPEVPLPCRSCPRNMPATQSEASQTF
jgi:pyruvate-formate lyase-activating enzyme